MTDREVWIKAGAILDKWGPMTADYIISHLSEALGDDVAAEDWRRVAAAVDVIAAASKQQLLAPRRRLRLRESASLRICVRGALRGIVAYRPLRMAFR
jgi:hypothetical protein